MKLLMIISSIFIATVAIGQTTFDNYFLDKTLRIDFVHAGNNTESQIYLEQFVEEPVWAGSKKNMIDKFNYGEYKLMVYDTESNILIFSTGFCSLFQEWRTTPEAEKIKRSFYESVNIPFPQKPVRIEIYERTKKNVFVVNFSTILDPKSYFIQKNKLPNYKTNKVVNNGEPSKKVDIVFLPEGYTQSEMEKFRKDCERFAGYLFKYSPFKENKDKFNIWGVEVPSDESGADSPGKGVWKRTAFNSTFYTFDLDRYIMTSDIKSIKDASACVPYDQIVILVNTAEYGGGGIYNYYGLFVANNSLSELIFVHEFGHSFAALADEYWTSEVAYEDYYDLTVEPYQPNITTLVDFDSKWKNIISKNVPIPTPDKKEYNNTIGAFEGGGYLEKGVYRPRKDCLMKSFSAKDFCPVCQKAILDMIQYFSE